jgi:predicted transcriptional regulator
LGYNQQPEFIVNQLSRLLGTSAIAHLGPLEQQLMYALWLRGDGTVRELIEEGGISLAYTTVMTTLDRLYKKKLLDRVAEGRAFRYAPRFSEEQLNRAAAGEAIRQLLGETRSAMPLSYLVEAVSEHDAELLDELQKIVERKRRELRRD